MEAALEYNERAADGAGADVVRCVWSLRGRADGGPPQPIVSDGCVELVFNMADPFEQELADGRRVIQPLAMVVGPTAMPTLVRPTGAIDIVGIRLQPWAARAVLGLPMSELRDCCEDLTSVSRGVLLQVPEQLADDASDLARFTRATTLMSVAHRRIRPIARHAVTRAVEAEEASVRQLAGLLGRSVRTIERVFSEEVGLSPKTVLRIARIQRALGIARGATEVRWGRVAMQAGYSDQSHFVREFRALVGCLPTEFMPEPPSLTTAFIED